MQNYNVLITNISYYEKSIPKEYVDEEDNNFLGQMTNEAPIKSLIERLSSNENNLDEIIFIESDKVRTKNADGISPANYLNTMLDDYLKSKNIPNIVRNVVEISDEPNAHDVSKAVFHVYDILEEDVLKHTNVNIYIEANGGIRYVLTMLLSVTQTLEKCYEGVHICEISSMVINQGKREGKSKPIQIVNTKRIYDSAQITEIVDEFLMYGRTNLLCEYVKQNNNDIEDEQKQDVAALIDKFVKTSNDMLLCRSAMMLDDFYGDDNLSSQISLFLQKYGHKEDYFSTVFSHIVRIIQKELNKNLYCENVEHKSQILYLPNIIDWCLKKDFLQQALTLTVECLPKYLFATGILSITDILEREVKKKAGQYDESYYFMAKVDTFISLADNAYSRALLQKLKKKSNSVSLPFSDADWNSIESKFKSAIPDVQLDKVENEYDEKILSFLHDVNVEKNLSKISKDKFCLLLSQNGFDEDLADIVCTISNSAKAPLYNVIRGEKRNKNGAFVMDTNLSDKKVRLEKTVIFLLERRTSDFSEESLKDVLNFLFEEDEKFIDIIYNRLGKTLISQFNVERLVKTKQLLSKKSDEDVQNIFHAFAICKEQRNFSNHGHVSEDKKEIAMSANEIKKLIVRTLKLCV